MTNVYLSILLVEDQDSKRKAIVELIESLEENIAIEFANSQHEALNILEKNKFDLLLLDMCLPLRTGDELDEGAGESILEELDFSDDYIRPSVIVALTQYDELQEELRQKYPELGAIKYSIENIDWQPGIHRIIKSCKKSKKMARTIIYCEEKNDKLFNQIGFKNIEFRGLKGGSRKIYECAKFETDAYAVRDKDYLTRNEAKWLTETKFSNYFILEYYCFENYLFHPDNLTEYCYQNKINFNIESYIEEITKQKNDNILTIVQGLQLSRNGYFDFTDNEKKNMDKNPEIIDCLKSNSFNLFYPYFDMKGTDKGKGFNKEILGKLNLDNRKLASTEWFRNKMETIFHKVLIH